MLLFLKNNDNWVVKDWCYGKSQVAIVSPKVYINNDEIILAYTERKVVYHFNFYKFKIVNYEESITKIKFYKNYNDLITCNEYKETSVYTGDDIDSGYPALIIGDKIYLYTYEKIENKTSIVERVFEL